MIPRRIHYCWFGRGPLPLLARRCLASWARRLPDYELVRWDEDSFDVQQHPFSAAAWQAGRYAFVSDYARMKVLHEQGGVYLDVDTEVYADFGDLLDGDLLIGQEDQGRFATSIIGMAPGHWLARSMLEYYDNTPFDAGRLSELVNVNEVSRLLLARGFSGDGGDEEVGADRVLAIGRLADARGLAVPGIRPLTRHLYAGSWKSRRSKSLPSRLWRSLRKLPGNLWNWLMICYYRLSR